MTSKDEVDAQKDSTGPKTVAEVVDVKPKTGMGAPLLMMADGNAKEIEGVGDFMARVNAGNIIIDPALAEKAAKGYLSPPLTIAEALERGDFVALAGMINAQIARAENGDLDGMRYEDKARYLARQKEKEALEESFRQREQQLSAYFDPSGGYRDRQGGYFNAKEGTYTDAEGGAVDNYQGYKYKDGSYKAKTGDYYDARTRTMHLANGDSYKISADTSDEDVIKVMQDHARERGFYDPNFIKNGQMGTADAEHPPSGPKRPGWSATQVQDVAAEARAHKGPDRAVAAPQAGAASTESPATTARDVAVSSQGNKGPAAPSAAPAGQLTVSSLKEKLAKAKAAKASAPETQTPNPASKFSSPAAETSRGGGNEVTSSSFFAVDSSISASKFPAPQPETVSDADPVVTANATTPARPAAKSPAP
ncbi:MAG: hypothetical protein EPN97_04040 [Alphaproteobacteria bacterium]|nr:MAG: hypothetical protein EPN97_04040 [Alphaproteobacteria bacterium]